LLILPQSQSPPSQTIEYIIKVRRILDWQCCDDFSLKPHLERRIR